MAYQKLILMGMVIVGIVCLSNGACAAKVCRHDGESFITKDCTGKCICQAGGSIACVSLCPPFHIDCPASQVKRYRQVPAGSGCSCRQPYCVPAKVCRYDYHTYKVGESFITKDCQGKCTCQAGGSIACVSLCPPVDIDCTAGQVKRYRQVPAGSGCSCRHPYCVPAKVCRFDDRTYKVGESFITKDCYARCKCQARGNVACVSLCPPVHIRCRPGHVVKYHKIAQGNGCFCRHPYCAKRVIYTPY